MVVPTFLTAIFLHFYYGIYIQQTDYNDFAKIYINQKYHHSTLNLDEIADQVGILKYHLDRSFHQKFGITIFNYIKHLRIEKACRLLTENNNLKTKEIAIMIGFSSDNYFCKTFKKVKGISPNNYKKQSNQYDLVRSLINHQKKLTCSYNLRKQVNFFNLSLHHY